MVGKRRNRKRAEQLLAEGRMAPAGLAEIEAAKADGRWARPMRPPLPPILPEDLGGGGDANPQARVFFDTLTGANRYAILYRVHDAKKPKRVQPGSAQVRRDVRSR